MCDWDDWKEFEDPFHEYDLNGDGEVDDLEYLVCTGDDELELGEKRRRSNYDDDELDDDFEDDYYVPIKAKPKSTAKTPVRQFDLTPPKTEIDEIYEVMPDEYKNEIVREKRKQLKLSILFGFILMGLAIFMIAFSFGSDGYLKGDAYEPLFGFGILFLAASTALIVAPPIILFCLVPLVTIKNEIKRMKSTYEDEVERGFIKSKRAKDYVSFLNVVNEKKQYEKVEVGKTKAQTP